MAEEVAEVHPSCCYFGVLVATMVDDEHVEDGDDVVFAVAVDDADDWVVDVSA